MIAKGAAALPAVEAYLERARAAQDLPAAWLDAYVAEARLAAAPDRVEYLAATVQGTRVILSEASLARRCSREELERALADERLSSIRWLLLGALSRVPDDASGR